jgi:hypothetical protein
MGQRPPPNEDLSPAGAPFARFARTGKWLAATVVFTAATIVSGIGLAALLGRSGAESTWNRWSAVGETFGALSTVVSGLALLAFVITFASQVRELKNQHAELILQGEALERSHAELHRDVETNLRRLHMDMLKLAIDDERLAAVWPPLEPGLPHEVNRQYLYANIVFQHHWLCLRISDYTEEQVESNLRYLFTSPLMRKYWRASSNARRFLVPDTDEFLFSRMADEICHEYERVLASDRTRSESAARWDQLNTASDTEVIEAEGTKVNSTSRKLGHQHVSDTATDEKFR